jgi:hypothetical protein
MLIHTGMRVHFQETLDALRVASANRFVASRQNRWSGRLAVHQATCPTLDTSARRRHDSSVGRPAARAPSSPRDVRAHHSGWCTSCRLFGVRPESGINGGPLGHSPPRTDPNVRSVAASFFPTRERRVGSRFTVTQSSPIGGHSHGVSRRGERREARSCARRSANDDGEFAMSAMRSVRAIRRRRAWRAIYKATSSRWCSSSKSRRAYVTS